MVPDSKAENAIVIAKVKRFNRQHPLYTSQEVENVKD